MRILNLSFVIFAAALMLAGCNETGSNRAAANAQNINVAPATPAASQSSPAAEQAMDPKKLYSKNCAACHKESGEGGKVEIDGKKINPDNLTSDKIKKFPDEKIARYIREGVEDEGMPAFKDKLTEEQISAIVAYVRTDLQKVRPQTPE